MTIYRMNNESIDPVDEATFSQLGIKERDDLQRLLRDRIEIVAPGTLVISEEFGDWDDSRRRIDLLAIDKEASIVVIELKRTEGGGHMELQAVRYAAMVSTMTFEQAVEVYASYLRSRQDSRDPRETILDFLEWEDLQEEAFGTDVRIVLASANFSKELTTAVLWLRDRTVDIRCVRIRPYGSKDDMLLDVQQVVPLPEAEDYQIRVERKAVKNREARTSSRDFTRFDVHVGELVIPNLPKRRAVLHVVKALVDDGADPDHLEQHVTWRSLFFKVEGQVGSDDIIELISTQNSPGNVRRWFTADDELIHHNGSTYAVCNQWGRKTESTISDMLAAMNSHNIRIKASS